MPSQLLVLHRTQSGNMETSYLAIETSWRVSRSCQACLVAVGELPEVTSPKVVQLVVILFVTRTSHDILSGSNLAVFRLF